MESPGYYCLLNYIGLICIGMYCIILHCIFCTHVYALDLSNVPMVAPKARYVPKEKELGISHLKAAWMFPLYCLLVSDKKLFPRIGLDWDIL